MNSYFRTITSPISIITAIDSNSRFPESLDLSVEKYKADINLFSTLVNESISSADLLGKIRNPKIPQSSRMSLLKIFRRAVSPVLDTEMSKKIKTVTTEKLVESFGHTFKDITLLKSQFKKLENTSFTALCALLSEYDSRGASGYELTDLFFSWIEEKFDQELEISGPRGAGKDIELNKIFPDFEGNFPCDFVIKERTTNKVLAIGFARYDSTRGGAQSDDRTGGNSNKVAKAEMYFSKKKSKIKIIFLADGPGLIHKDTWQETCALDGSWGGNVRVTTLKTLNERITLNWLKD